MNAADLKRFPLLAELSDEDREALFELLETQSVRKGRSVFRQTAEADGLVFLVSGKVALSRENEAELGQIGPGEILGTASLLTMGQREATAKAAEPSEIALLSRNAYRRLVEDHPRTACRLTEAIAQDLSSLLREALPRLGAGQ